MDDTNSNPPAATDASEAAPAPPPAVFVPALNENNHHDVIGAYRKIMGKSDAAEHQRQALYLMIFTNPRLGNFKQEATTGLLGIDKQVPKKWAKGEFGKVVEAIEIARRPPGGDVQEWRGRKEYKEALQELGMLPREQAVEARPAWQSDINMIASLNDSIGLGRDAETLAARQALTLLAYEYSFRRQGRKSFSAAAETLDVTGAQLNGWRQPVFTSARAQLENEDFRSWRKTPAYEQVLGKLNALVTGERQFWKDPKEEEFGPSLLADAPNEAKIQLPRASEPVPVPQSTIDAVSASLEEMLKPNARGEVLFGAQSQPLRQSQVEMLQTIKDNVQQHRTTGNLVAPGGSGKTRVGIAFAYACHKKGLKTLFVVDRQDSLKKFADDATTLCPDLKVGKVYEKEKSLGNLTFITYDSLLARVNAFLSGKPCPDGAPIDPREYAGVIWDESHMYLTKNGRNLLSNFSHAINPAFTATPDYYEGKDVTRTFGPIWHEVSYETAKARGEVCDFENKLINTRIHTGLNLEPEEEESPAVAIANNRRDRNLIFVEEYKDGVIHSKKLGKDVPLAGMSGLVLVAGIDHTHDLAALFNEILDPLLKTDPVFREKLKEKGIDPDKVKHVAAAVHSGDTARHEAMDSEQRKAVMKQYDNHEVLLVVATKVLQQSFDSPQSQLLMDTVARGTYVGVGQAGYRVTRTFPGKEFCAILNTEDEDRTTYTFKDFLRMRSGEVETEEKPEKEYPEGADRKPAAKKPAITINKERALSKPMADYSTVSGDELDELLAMRRRERRRLYYEALEEESMRIFSTADYIRRNNSLAKICNGDKNEIGPFIEAIQPYIAAKMKRIVGRSPDAPKVSKEALDEAGMDSALEVIGNLLNSDRFTGWSRFTAIFSRKAETKIEALQSHRGEFKTIPLTQKRMNRMWYDPEPELLEAFKSGKIQEVLKTLTPREQKVIEERFLNDRTLEEVAQEFDVTRERIRQIEARALRQLRSPSRANLLR